MGNSLYPRTSASDDQYHAGVNECFCAMKTAIESCNWDRFVVLAKAANGVELLCYRDHLGRTILHYAAMNPDCRYVEGVLLLIKHLSKSEDPHPYLDPDFHGNTPLHLALGCENHDGAHMIFEAAPNFEYGPNKLGNTPLHLAVMHDNVHCAKLLLKIHPEFKDVANKDGKKPSDLAKSDKMKDLFESHGIKCSQTIAFIAISPDSAVSDRSPRSSTIGASTNGRRIPTVPGSQTLGSQSINRFPVVPVGGSYAGPASPRGLTSPLSPRSLGGYGQSTTSPRTVFTGPTSSPGLTSPRSLGGYGQSTTSPRSSNQRIPVVPVAGASSPRFSGTSPSRIPVVPIAGTSSPRFSGTSSPRLGAPISPSRIPNPTRIPIGTTSPASLSPAPVSPRGGAAQTYVQQFSPEQRSYVRQAYDEGLLYGQTPEGRLQTIGNIPAPGGSVSPQIPRQFPTAPVLSPRSPTIIPSPRSAPVNLGNLPRIPGTL